MFTKRTIKPHTPVTSVDTASEALAVSLAEKARVDIPFMKQLTGKDEETLVSELEGVIFRIPAPKDRDGISVYQTADEYLSGNVREKLQTARAALEVSEYSLPMSPRSKKYSRKI
jgi:N12 class adenine-specific DNA methylase